MNHETIIAVSALLLSLYGIFATNRHNRLSVKPHVVGNRRMDWNDEGLTVTFELLNHGFGPARVRKFSLSLDGKPYNPTESIDLIEGIIRARLDGKFPYRLKRHSVPTRGYCILAGQAYVLFELFIPNAKKIDVVAIGNAFEGADVTVDYESFYGQKGSYTTR